MTEEEKRFTVMLKFFDRADGRKNSANRKIRKVWGNRSPVMYAEVATRRYIRMYCLAHPPPGG